MHGINVIYQIRGVLGVPGSVASVCSGTCCHKQAVVVFADFRQEVQDASRQWLIIGFYVDEEVLQRHGLQLDRSALYVSLPLQKDVHCLLLLVCSHHLAKRRILYASNDAL